MAEPIKPVSPADLTGDGKSYLERMNKGMGNSDPEVAKDFAERLKRYVDEGKEIRKSEEAKKAERLTGVGEYKPRTSGGSGGGGMPKLNRDISKNYKNGGKITTASKRADGCAQRGKTRGKIV